MERKIAQRSTRIQLGSQDRNPVLKQTRLTEVSKIQISAKKGA